AGRRRHTSFSRDWSADVCSSDLGKLRAGPRSDRIDVTAQADVRISIDAYLGTLARTHCVEVGFLEVRFDIGAVVGDQGQHGQARSEERRVGEECRCAWPGEDVER